MASQTDQIDDKKREDNAQKLCIATGLMMTAVTMVVPTRAPMVLTIKKGNPSETARAMGLMTTFAGVIELVVNPILGKMSDQYGRKPFLMMAATINAFLHTLVAAMPMSLPMQFLDRMISGSMIFGFLAPAQAAMADLYSHDTTKLGIWQALMMGTYFGVGTTVGPFIGSKLGGAPSFFASAVSFVATMLYVNTQLDETLQKSKPFKWSDINPVAFLKLFKDKTMGWLAITASLQSFGDYVNIYDINNLFMMKTLKYGPSEIGNFATTVGVSQIAGGKVTKQIIGAVGLNKAALFANMAWALGMTAMGNSRTTPQAFLALAIWTFGHQRANSVGAFMQQYGAKHGMGKAEIVAATGNLLSYVKIMIPLLYSNLFAWATSNGRDMAGLPYFVISGLTLLAQFCYMQAGPEEVKK